MTLLVAALLFGVSGVAGVTVITLSALSYAKHLDTPADPDETRCGSLKGWTRSRLVGRAMKETPWDSRCLLPDGHHGPHKVDDVRSGHEGEPFLWTDPPPKKESA
jgi:hypothetical protein